MDGRALCGGFGVLCDVFSHTHTRDERVGVGSHRWMCCVFCFAFGLTRTSTCNGNTHS